MKRLGVKGLTELPFGRAKTVRSAAHKPWGFSDGRPWDDTSSVDLVAQGISVRFEGLVAVDAVDLHLRAGEILGLIGPNGAGKTTLINALSGFVRSMTGRVSLGEIPVTRWSPAKLSRLGMARTFQSVRLFRDLSVIENVAAAGVCAGLSRRQAWEDARALLRRINFEERATDSAASLAHGDERRVGILRALATQPKVLLIDEPSAGLNEIETDQVTEVLSAIRNDFGCALLVVEHDMRLIMSLCNRIQVLDRGRTISVGTPAETRANPAVVQAYLGTAAAS